MTARRERKDIVVPELNGWTKSIAVLLTVVGMLVVIARWSSSIEEQIKMLSWQLAEADKRLAKIEAATDPTLVGGWRATVTEALSKLLSAQLEAGKQREPATNTIIERERRDSERR
jgi:hypothetical protein